MESKTSTIFPNTDTKQFIDSDIDTDEENDNDFEEIIQSWEYNGVNYLVDIGTNELYSPETKRVIAKRQKYIVSHSPLRWKWIIVGISN